MVFLSLMGSLYSWLPWMPEVVSLEHRFRPANRQAEGLERARSPAASNSRGGASRSLSARASIALAGLKRYSKHIQSETTSGTQGNSWLSLLQKPHLTKHRESEFNLGNSRAWSKDIKKSEIYMYGLGESRSSLRKVLSL